MAEDDMMDSLPPLRMATPGEYEALAAALVRYGRHRYNCTGFMGGPCSCGLAKAADDAAAVVLRLGETLDQEVARETRRDNGNKPA